MNDDLRSAILGTEATPPEPVAASIPDQGIANMVVSAIGAVQSATSALASIEVALGEVLRQLAEREAADKASLDTTWLDDGFGHVEVAGDPMCVHDWLDVSTMGGEQVMCSKCGRQVPVPPGAREA